ncbi:metallophosphoesterase family protein [Caldisphaera sp.]|uniref:metallophosphoesterase family protein n=1 Tax=Caldisphaera sp. TaxID=2060322 RepID=UPI003D12C093
MHLLFVSDIHMNLKIYKGVDESYAMIWLNKLIDKIKPDVLLSAGDWDKDVTPKDFSIISSKVKLITIYGNHENFNIIKDYSIKDGKVIKLNNISISGINGLLEEKVSFSWKNIKEENIIESYLNKIIRDIKKYTNNLDIFISHQPPFLPEVYPGMIEDIYNKAMLNFIKELRPKLYLNGHMKPCYSFYEFPYGTKYLRVDSSQSCKHFAIINTENSEVVVYYDDKYKFREILSFKF